MRVAFLSDLQLGGGAVYGTPERPRLADQEAALAWIADELRRRGITDLVIAGDVFDRRKPAPDELLVFTNFLARVEGDIEIVVGNHDLRAPGLPIALDVFNVFVAAGGFGGANVRRRPHIAGLKALDRGRDAAVAMLPWTHPANLRAARGGTVAMREHADAVVAEAAALRAKVQEFDADAVPILVTHYSLAGVQLPTGLFTGELVATEPVLDTHSLLAQGWAYVFAGHVHSTDVYEPVMNSGAVVSIGSPWIQDFGEAGERHGFWVLDVALGTLEHVEVPGRPFVTLDWTGLDGFAEWETTGFFDARLAEAVVRLRWSLTEEEAASIDVEKVKRAILGHGALKVHSIHVDVERAHRGRAENVAEDSEPIAALDAWLAASGSTPAEGDRLRELTVSLIEEV